MSRSRTLVWLRSATLGCLALALAAGSAEAALVRPSKGLVNKAGQVPDPAGPGAPAAPVAPAAPDAAPGAETELDIKLVALQGNVQIRLSEDQAWQAGRVGMKLNIGTEVRTGLRSLCRFTIDGNHAITLDRLGVVKVLDAIQKDGLVKTDVGMKYGRTQYQVEVGAAQHDSRVHAPSATLAVRGSFITFEDNAAFGSTAVVAQSERAIYKQRAMAGSLRVVQMELVKGRVEEPAGKEGEQLSTPAQTALRDTINDVGARLARASELERDLVAIYPTFNGGDSAGIISPNDIRAQESSSSIPRHPTPPSEPGTIQAGGLFIEAFWTGPEDIFLFAMEPAFSGGLISTVSNNPSGATTFLRSEGIAPATVGGTGPGMGSNMATIIYPNGVPSGSWNVGVGLVNESTSLTTPVNISIVRTAPSGGGSPQQIFNFNTTLGVTGPGETTIKVTTSFSVGGPP